MPSDRQRRPASGKRPKHGPYPPERDEESRQPEKRQKSRYPVQRALAPAPAPRSDYAAQPNSALDPRGDINDVTNSMNATSISSPPTTDQGYYSYPTSTSSTLPAPFQQSYAHPDNYNQGRVSYGPRGQDESLYTTTNPYAYPPGHAYPPATSYPAPHSSGHGQTLPRTIPEGSAPEINLNYPSSFVKLPPIHDALAQSPLNQFDQPQATYGSQSQHGSEFSNPNSTMDDYIQQSDGKWKRKRIGERSPIEILARKYVEEKYFNRKARTEADVGWDKVTLAEQQEATAQMDQQTPTFRKFVDKEKRKLKVKS